MVMVSRLSLCFNTPGLNASALKTLPPDRVRLGAGGIAMAATAWPTAAAEAQKAPAAE